MQNTYYKFCSTQLKLSEFWRVSPGPFAFVVLAILKLLKVNIPQEWAMGHCDNQSPVQLDELPVSARDSILANRNEGKSLGFQPMFTRKADSLGNRLAFSDYQLSANRTIVFDMTYYIVRQNGKNIEEAMLIFASQLSNGEFLMTTNSKSMPSLSQPIRLKISKANDTQFLLDEHRKRLASQPSIPKPINGEHELLAFVSEFDNVQVDQMVDRGLLVPISDGERDQLEAVQIPEFAGNNVQDAMISNTPQALANTQGQQQLSTGRFSKMMWLALSVVAGFAGVLAVAAWAIRIGGLGQPALEPVDFPEPTTAISSVDSIEPNKAVKITQQKPATIYLNLNSENAAEEALDQFAKEDGVVVSKFGNTVVVELPMQNARQIRLLRDRALSFDASSFFDNDNFNVATSIKFRMDNAAAAERIGEIIDAYIFASEYEIGSPWNPNFQLTGKYQSARRTYREIQRIDIRVEDDEELGEELEERLFSGNQEDAEDAVRQLARSIDERRRAAYQEYLKNDPTADKEVVAEWVGLIDRQRIRQQNASKMGDAERLNLYEKHRLKMAALLGPIPVVANAMTEQDARRRDYSIIGGSVIVEGAEVRLESLACYRTTIVMQALVAWLEQENAAEIRYCVFDQHKLFNIEQ